MPIFTFLSEQGTLKLPEVYQRCRSLGTILEHHPQLCMKDPLYSSRPGIPLNF
ncbi:vav guanine nucleotide exchange factor 3 [Homo sapiens]|uniref:Vav guanine nucleotide exchange factor 3 n=1 Tax=Homo sapiens TaxID=9606 RepID=E9PMJ5_HUMAN|nr:vav guanine nucleotide exchange factor 3 [Homo sapiens]KAI2518147.1 vav guanine nucleotide exchange factor 3 [Homo sapiens]KAI4081685.1 vav guanine nucleotide exchange factor 3 [Homo sapiens]KAI4081687.1 vav guanine nucleotide exchange factor 3 [Homo sapiens]